MNNTENNKKDVHQGKNAKRLREAKGVKQDAIAMELGISQQAVSQLERRQELDDATIAAYAKVLEIDEVFIRNMPDDSLPEVAANFFDQSSQILNFNPLDKLMELYSEKDQLYERIVKLEKEKSALLRQSRKDQK
ncbi:helix-turn-helix domain-containing protein [Proteiniphilum acetatigenes]|uniref:helix-turn-helix domain-containing protein n=1 Tax=Proteiniphilum acetatigenes TaxID=294710 RepID=UPI00037EC189|nr:helix-turn-helix transcriptional regulator [Proteiniphilum acetatigenes]